MNRAFTRRPTAVIWLTALLLSLSAPAPAATQALPVYLADRGEGIPTSLFGTYVREGELLVYAFYEYYRDSDTEYAPDEFGFNDSTDYFGRSRAHEYLIFFAYAFNDSFALEFEAAPYITETLWKSKKDNSGMPKRITESGWGDTEINLRWRALKETTSRPEVTAYTKVVFPLQKNKDLIGTQDWEFEPGVVVTKGFAFGTLALRGGLAYDTGEYKLESGEYALDYVKRLNADWRLVLSYEGEQDEAVYVAELQYQFAGNATLKLNVGYGATKKATDFAPEIGVMWSF